MVSPLQDPRIASCCHDSHEECLMDITACGWACYELNRPLERELMLPM